MKQTIKFLIAIPLAIILNIAIRLLGGLIWMTKMGHIAYIHLNNVTLTKFEKLHGKLNDWVHL